MSIAFCLSSGLGGPSSELHLDGFCLEFFQDFFQRFRFDPRELDGKSSAQVHVHVCDVIHMLLGAGVARLEDEVYVAELEQNPHFSKGQDAAGARLDSRELRLAVFLYHMVLYRRAAELFYDATWTRAQRPFPKKLF